MPGTMKIKLTGKGRISYIQGDNCFVFVKPDLTGKKTELYINIGGKTFYAKSKSPITLDDIK